MSVFPKLDLSRKRVREKTGAEMPSCRTPRYSPPVHIIKLAQQREITPCTWYILTTMGRDRVAMRQLRSEKIPKAHQLDDVFRRQDRADHIGLRRGVNFVEMPLRFAKLHKPPDALF
jgi:hypothetical protein